MVLFAVNTGLRDSNVCQLQWLWEVPVPQIGRSVFVIPREAFKSRRAHVVILNDAAWSILQAQRHQHPIWVFPYRGRPIGTMNNTAWQNARRKAGLRAARIHDLRHTYGARLRAAGVAHEDRAALLGHACGSMPELYARPDIGRLLSLANRVLERSHMITVLRLANGGASNPGLWINSRAEVAQPRQGPGFDAQVIEIWRARQDLNPRPLGS
jgi:integrase